MSLPVSPSRNLNLQNDNTIITVAVVKSTATIIKGSLGGVGVELMLDSGSSVSLVQCDVLKGAQNIAQVTAGRPIQLVTASGDQLPILQHVKASVQLGELHVLHKFVVVKTLVAPVILGINFLQGLTLDFTQNPVAVSKRPPKVTSLTQNSMAIAQVVPIYKGTQKKFSKYATFLLIKNLRLTLLMIVLSPITRPHQSRSYLRALVPTFTVLWRSIMDCSIPSQDAWLYIPTVGNPVNV